MPSTIENITIIRHLKDSNDLASYGTDNPLEPGQEDIALAVGSELRQDALDKGYKGIVLLVSPKIRVLDSAQAIKRGILANGHGFKAKILVDNKIRELDQGVPNLPKDYVPGMHFKPLDLAWEALWQETFGVNNNLAYEFGSPYSRGVLTHPELSGHFLCTGESYKDQSIRLYSAIHSFGQKLDNFRRMKPVIVTHSAPLAIFRELELIARDVQEGRLTVPEGGLVQLSWDYFERRVINQHPNYGQHSQISLSALFDPNILDILKREINYLKHYNS